jgi:hypothetical protein
MGEDRARPHPRHQEIHVSTPGSGPQDPNQSGEPTNWGQQPPAAGQPYPGQQPAAGQPFPGQQPPAGQQPWAAGQPGQPTGAQAFGEPAKPDAKKKWLPIIGGIVALVVAVTLLSSFFGGGDPEIGDCIKPDGTSFEKVDCSDDEAEAKVVGTDDDMTGDEFDAADANELCTETPSATVVLWSGTDESKDGKVFCAEPV